MSVFISQPDFGRVDYGDITAIDGSSELSIAINVRVEDILQSNERFCGKWGSAATNQCFLLSVPSGTTKIGLAIGMSTSGIYARRTADSFTKGPMNLVATWSTGDNIAIYINGRPVELEAWISTGSPTSLQNSAAGFQVGLEVDTLNGGVRGIYRDVALWTRELVQQEAMDISAGRVKPTKYNRDLVFYDPLLNRESFDIIGRVSASHVNTSPRSQTEEAIRVQPGPLTNHANPIIDGGKIYHRWAGDNGRGPNKRFD